jgi:putative component of toxin-antitoxin plasmid stabilization module
MKKTIQKLQQLFDKIKSSRARKKISDEILRLKTGK